MELEDGEIEISTNEFEELRKQIDMEQYSIEITLQRNKALDLDNLIQYSDTELNWWLEHLNIKTSECRQKKEIFKKHALKTSSTKKKDQLKQRYLKTVKQIGEYGLARVEIIAHKAERRARRQIADWDKVVSVKKRKKVKDIEGSGPLAIVEFELSPSE
jgi:hypothetical protein